MLESIVDRRDSGTVFVISWDNGSGKPKNWRKAFQLLARLYEAGNGIDRDLERARQLYLSIIDHGRYSLWSKDPQSGQRTYTGYSRTPHAALGLCRLSESFHEIVTYCKAFERSENSDAIEDTEAVRFALHKYEDYIQVQDPELRLIRGIRISDMDVVEAALKDGADTSVQVSASEIEKARETVMITPLWAAVSRTNIAIIKKLLVEGADTNLVPDGQGHKSLLEAAWGWSRGTKPKEMVVFGYLDELMQNGYSIDLEQLKRIHLRSRQSAFQLDSFDKLLKVIPDSVSQAFLAEDAERKERVAAKEREKNRVEAIVQAADLAAKRKIGARLCQVDQRSTYIGFVERQTDEKVQIRISQSFLTRNPTHQDANFRESIIWDYPSAWTLCE